MAYNTGTDPTLAELITSRNVPDIFSKEVLFHTMSNLVIADRVNVQYRRELTKGRLVYIPAVNEVTDAEITPGTALTPSDAAGTPVSVTIDQWRGAAAEISDMADIEDGASYLQNAAKSCAYRIAKRVDTKLSSLFSTLSGDSVEGSDGQTFTDEIFQSLVEGLDEADIPGDDRCLIGDPSTRIDMYNIDKFIRTDYVREAVIPTGKIGQLYNAPIFITNNVTAATTGNYGVYMQRDALALVIQNAARTQIVKDTLKFRTVIQVDIIFGVGELRDTFGKSFYTRKS